MVFEEVKPKGLITSEMLCCANIFELLCIFPCQQWSFKLTWKLLKVCYSQYQLN